MLTAPPAFTAPSRTRWLRACFSPSAPSVARTPFGAALWGLVAAGVALRLATYFANRSLFMDEVALALSIRDRGFLELLSRPLDYAQTAPPGFLLLLEASTRALGESEYSLRLPALLAGVLSVPLFALLTRRTLPPAGVLVAVALFAFGRPLVYYATEAKPYAFDVLAAVVLLLALLLVIRGPASGRRLAGVAAVGALSVWFSHAALFLVASLAPVVLAALFFRGWRAEAGRFFCAVAVPWAISAALALAWSLDTYPPEARAFMRFYWHTGLPPFPPASLEDLQWLPLALFTFGLDPLGVLLPFYPQLLVALGIVALRPRLHALPWLALAPLLLTVGAAFAGLYPFGRNDPNLHAYDGRVLLFLTPGVLLLLGAGVGRWLEGRAVGARRASLALLVLSTIAPTLFFFPYERRGARQVLEAVARMREPGEAVHVDYQSQHYFRFYAPALGLDRGPVVWGECHNPEPRGFVAEWEALRPMGGGWLLTLQPMYFHLALRDGFLAAQGRESVRVSRGVSQAVRFRFRSPEQLAPIPDALIRLPPGATPELLRLSCRGPWRR